ncbi:hypothetical protein [Actinomadura spongiicola]|uniref:hypothetical protein n=1 Tax=Actinomadura spongiicola TaxID=2303421 RepID=UPI001314859A|nr:hypothetical protein [Actinomadura spongiicola]
MPPRHGGAGIAGLGAVVLNAAGLLYVVPVFGKTDGDFVSATIGARLDKETLLA